MKILNTEMFMYLLLMASISIQSIVVFLLGMIAHSRITKGDNPIPFTKKQSVALKLANDDEGKWSTPYNLDALQKGEDGPL